MDEYKPHIVKRNGFWKLDFSKCSGRQLMRYEVQRKRAAFQRCQELNKKLAQSQSIETISELFAQGWLNPVPKLGKPLPERKVLSYEISRAFPGEAHAVLECGHSVTIRLNPNDAPPSFLKCLNCKE